MGNSISHRMRFDEVRYPMHACIRDGNMSKLRHLIVSSSAEDIAAMEFSWGTALHVAVLCESLPAVDMLLEAGACPLVLPSFDTAMTPLGTAARMGNWAIVERLWHCVPPEKREEDRYTSNSALGAAAMYGQVHIVEMLLDRWNGWSMKYMEGALISGTLRWRANVVDLLLERVNFSQETIDWALRKAADYKPMFAEEERTGMKYDGTDYLNQQRLIERLIKAGADPNADIAPRYPHTSLILTVSRSVDLVGGLKALLENGADPNACNTDGESALHLLGSPVGVEQQSSKTCVNETGIRLLLENGASVCLRDNQGNSPLHCAAFGSNLYIFRLYLSAAKPEEQESIAKIENDHGETLLHWAAAGGKVEIVNYLISRGCDVNKVNENGWTPFVCSLAPSIERRARLLGHKSKRPWAAIQTARVLLSHGAEPLVATQEKWTPLHCLAMHLDEDEAGEAYKLSEELISRGADMEARAPMLMYSSKLKGRDGEFVWGWRAQNLLNRYATDAEVVRSNLPLLHWAAHHGAVGVIKAILTQGGNHTCADADGMYPATTVIKSEIMKRDLEVSKKVLDLLIEAGVGT